MRTKIVSVVVHPGLCFVRKINHEVYPPVKSVSHFIENHMLSGSVEHLCRFLEEETSGTGLIEMKFLVREGEAEEDGA